MMETMFIRSKVEFESEMQFLFQDPGLCSRPLFPSLPRGDQGQFSWVGYDDEEQ